ncbi:MAG: hypothetical protein JKY89_03560 [Immundisolibacteraceae bacterium]|nr:hypothetical protein [Immundisolibacteraceae bacterium]
MRNSKLSLMGLLCITAVLSTGTVLADESEAGGTEQSFMQRWFGWGQQADNQLEQRASQHNQQASKPQQNKQKADKGSNRPGSTFSQSERSSIVDYYRSENSQHSSGKGKAKGKAKKQKQLPPGLQKKLARGGQLPPGWQTKVSQGEVLNAELLSHAYPLPDDLRKALPNLQDGTELRRIGDKVVRIMEGNGTVLDVIDLAGVVLAR